MIAKEKINELHELLVHSGYKQIETLVEIGKKWQPTYTGVEVFCSALTMDVHVQAIKDLLAGMGYSVEGNTNRETITIK